MPLVWQWRRERETSYMLGLTAVFASSPLGGGACGAHRPPRVGWGCGSTRGPAKGVAWGGAGREGERGRGGRVGGRGGGAVWGGVHPLRAAAQTRAETPWRHFPGLPMGRLGKCHHGVFPLAPSRERWGKYPLTHLTGAAAERLGAPGSVPPPRPEPSSGTLAGPDLRLCPPAPSLTLLAAVVPQVGVHGREDPHSDLFSGVLAARNGPVSTCMAARFATAHHNLA